MEVGMGDSLVQNYKKDLLNQMYTTEKTGASAFLPNAASDAGKITESLLGLQQEAVVINSGAYDLNDLYQRIINTTGLQNNVLSYTPGEQAINFVEPMKDFSDAELSEFVGVAEEVRSATDTSIMVTWANQAIDVLYQESKAESLRFIQETADLLKEGIQPAEGQTQEEAVVDSVLGFMANWGDNG